MTISINKNYICISNDIVLTSLISNTFNRKNEYFIILEPPRMRRPDSSNEVIRIMNVISLTRPKKIILANLESNEELAIREKLRIDQIIIINSINDLYELDGFEYLQSDNLMTLECNQENILKGLTSTRNNRKKIIFNNEKSAEFNDFFYSNNKHLLVIENSRSISTVIGVNYANAFNMSVLFIPEITLEDVRKIERELINIGEKIKLGFEYKEDLESIKKNLSKSFKNFDFTKYKSITFITKGLPYGLAIENKLPVCHMLENGLGEFIFNNIFYENNNCFLQSALVFSPGKFEDEETERIIKLFYSKNFHIKSLIKEEADFDNVDQYFPFYPYDFLHLCSHGGEFEGYEVVEEIVDRFGNKHLLKLKQVLAHSNKPDKNDRVVVWEVNFFQEIDGFKWASIEAKENVPKYVFEDMEQLLKKGIEANELSREKIGIIPGSFGLLCFENFHPFAFHVLANHNYPIIFNNTCYSWYTLGATSIFAGARAYIGTLFIVENQKAVDFSSEFYMNIFSKNIIEAFFEACKIDSFTYIYYGTHFSRLKYNPSFSEENMLRHITSTIKGLKLKLPSVKNNGVRDNTIRWIKFLEKILENDFSNT